MWSDALYLLLAILAILVVLVDATMLTKKRKNIVTNGRDNPYFSI